MSNDRLDIADNGHTLQLGSLTLYYFRFFFSVNMNALRDREHYYYSAW